MFELLFEEIDTDDSGEISKEELYDYYLKQENDWKEEDTLFYQAQQAKAFEDDEFFDCVLDVNLSRKFAASVGPMTSRFSQNLGENKN